MKTSTTLSALTLAGLVAASLSTAAFAEKGGMGGPGMMPLMNFEAIDTDKDGKLTKDEITAFMASRATQADTNKDGKLSPEELVAMHEKARMARETERATAMVGKMDSDGDGLLTPAEMAAGPGAGKMFDHIDEDKDGTLSKAEVDMMKAHMEERMGENGKKHGKHGGKHGGFFNWMNDEE